MRCRFLKEHKFYLIALLGVVVNFLSIVLFSSDIYFIGRISVVIGGLAMILGIRENIKNMYLEKEMLQKNYEPNSIKKMLSERR